MPRRGDLEMAIGRGEKISSVFGVILIALSILIVVGKLGSPETVGELHNRLNTVVLPLFNDLDWIIPILGVYWGWKLIVGGPYVRPVLVSAFVFTLYFAFSTFSHIAAGTEASAGQNVGGKIGHHFAETCEHIFGSYGSRIVTMAGVAVMFILATGVSVRKGALRLEAVFGRLAGVFRDALLTPAEKPKPKVSRRAAGRQDDAAAVGRPEPVVPKKAPQVAGPLFAGRLELQPQVEALPAAERVSASAPEGRGGSEYRCPALSIFEDCAADVSVSEDELRDLATYLEDKLSSFGIEARVSEIHPGPVITRFEIEPGSSTKVHQVVNLADDLALALKARSLRILAPIPGKGTIGIEVPNKRPSTVRIKEILASNRFKSSGSKLEMALGKDVAGNPYTADLEVMPHLLIAGATGSGKSVCINTVITSLVYRNSPDDVQLILIDPKRLELNQYEGIPHLLCEVVTEPKKAVRALAWVVEEMDMRYQLLAKRGVRNIQSYEEGLPYIVIVIDELADLMLTVPQEIETAVAKLAQMARAVGIHLVMATQRPSVDVITGVIKANFPCRIAFKVASKIDSRTIIDANGAERLLGRGDMLFLAPGTAEPIRVHGAFVSSEETRTMVEFLKQQSHLAVEGFSLEAAEHHEVPVDQRDELFEDAARIVITHQQGSVSLLQRRLKVGYSRAARLIDFLEEAGIVGPFEGSKARQVLVDETFLEHLADKR
jgi:S-DNA-T family DNA segregation ATPase FtsK/SpoIIIE